MNTSDDIGSPVFSPYKRDDNLSLIESLNDEES